MNNGKFIPLDYKLTPIHESRIDNNIFMNGTKWAEVDEADFKKKVRKFYSAPHKPKEWAEKLSSVLKEKYSQKSINEHYSKSLNGLL